MKYLHLICTLLFGLAVLLFFGLAYPHHLHYQEQYQLFLFDSTYLWDVVKHPGGVTDLLGRFCTQFFLFAWVGAAIIALLLSAVQLLTLRLINSQLSTLNSQLFYGLSFVPSFLLWLFLLDENALLSGVWAVLLTLLVACLIVKLTSGWLRRILLIIAIPILYILVGPVCFPIPIDSLWLGVHYYRYPTTFPWLLWAAAISAFVIVGLVLLIRHRLKHSSHLSPLTSYLSFALVAVVMGVLIWKNVNIKAEKVMKYDFMACHQQWNRIIETVNKDH